MRQQNTQPRIFQRAGEIQLWIDIVKIALANPMDQDSPPWQVADRMIEELWARMPPDLPPDWAELLSAKRREK